MSNLEKVKEIIKDNISMAQAGMFCTRNTMGDHMINIYDNKGIYVDVCYDYGYFEVFGLSDIEFSELHKYYKSLGGF